MSTKCTILSFLTKMIERKPVRRRERVQCQPHSEQMEPRALLSSFKVGVSTLVPSQTVGGALVIRAEQSPSVHVTYQPLGIEADIKAQINIEND